MLARPHLVVWILLLASRAAQSQADLLALDIGDPAGRVSLEVPRDAIVDTRRGAIISTQTLGAQLRQAPIVLVAEQHTDAAYHALQLRVLELLHDAGRRLVVALEMFPADLALVLDAWTRAELDETDFLASSDWYRTWGYDWRYYRELFLFAREHSIPMVGLRAREATPAVDVAADLDSADHETLVRAFFEADSPVHGGLTDAQFASLFEAQSRRDAQMAAQVLDARRRYPERTVVVLAGTGHVLYGLGIARQLPATERLAAVTIVPIPVAASATNTTVSANVADFAWGFPENPHPAYPELGVLTTGTDTGLRVIFVEPASPAAAAGIAVGDLLTHFGTWPLDSRSALGRALGSTQWGDEIAIGVQRDADARTVSVLLRRVPGDQP